MAQITSLAVLRASVAAMDGPDPATITVSDDVWCDWVELWNRNLSRNRQTGRDAYARCKASGHEFVGIESGGRVCRVCCRYSPLEPRS